tara:strand:+ start:1153 stop:1761 length:609 start_codon:yes stop_codon:yes gene_type:complete
MRSFSEIEITVKRATKAIGFSWGIAEEVGKNVRLLEMFGLPGLKNINQYYKIYKISNFDNIKEISLSNSPKTHYCPILSGLNFYDQSSAISEFNELEIINLAFPILFIPFVSRTSEIIGKRIFLKMDNKEFLFNFNQSIYSNYLSGNVLEKADKVKIQFLENKNTFTDDEWSEMYKLSEKTYVEESEGSKERTAGAGLTDND